MSVNRVFVDDVLREIWDNDARRVTYFDKNGNLMATAPGGEAPNPRPYTLEENAAVNASLVTNQLDNNLLSLSNQVVIDAVIAEMERRIGGGTYVATGIQDPEASLTSLSNMSNAALAADFQSNIGRWLKLLLRDDKRLANQTIRLLRLVGNRLDSASVGDET